ncbi:hypothetical protein B0T16DRAFT_66891 [Cercophora newfieldiana]|uniref:Uncharacterized protein n=1 Tax=Cercophora newfieldiana TaxID=92897 RepID=A0AA39YU67_9PEZI|nr:hypothetical protein B0T16DRAFT_66891 [Cercophora newfieldiana]
MVRRNTKRSGHPAGSSGPSIAGLELPEGFTKNGVNGGNNNQGKGPSTPPKTAEALATIPKPWDIDDSFPKPKMEREKLYFDYNRPWVSYRVKPEQVGSELARDLARQKRELLPAILKGAPRERLAQHRRRYEGAGELQLFDIRYKNVNTNGFTRLIFTSPVAARDERRTEFLNEDTALIKILRMPELASQIIANLLPSVRNVSVLAATCRDAAIEVSANMEIWGATTGEFALDRFKGHMDERTGAFVENKGVRQSVLCIAASDVQHLKTVSPYVDGWNVINKFIRGVVEIKNSFKDVIIDQLPYFDVRLFEMMLQSMPNLETVAISRCLLFDFTKLEPLITAIKKHPRTRKGKKKYVRVDFAPYFFDGGNFDGRYGSYGITHHMPFFPIARAATALLIDCMPKAREIGMDLTSESSAFWRFFCRLPGPDALWQVKVRDACAAHSHALAELGTNRPEDSSRYKKIRDKYADDLMAAVLGDGVAPVPLPEQVTRRRDEFKPAKFGHWRKLRTCTTCSADRLEVFMTLHVHRCWSCDMVEFVDEAEDSHFRYRLKATLGQFLDGIDSQRASFRTLIDADRAPMIHLANELAKDTDRAWTHHLLHATGNAPAIPPYPEPPVHTTFKAASVRRLALAHRGLKAVDFRCGGPQLLHPCHTRKFNRNLEEFEQLSQYGLPPGSQDLETFKLKWQWTEHTTDLMVAKLQCMDLSATGIDAWAWVERAKNNKRQREFAMKLEWMHQCVVDKKFELHAFSRIEDAVVSVIGPSGRPHNKDKDKERLPLSDDMCEGKGYMQDSF